MRCPECDHENRQDAVYCAVCGTRLTAENPFAVTDDRSGRAVTEDFGPEDAAFTFREEFTEHVPTAAEGKFTGQLTGEEPEVFVPAPADITGSHEIPVREAPHTGPVTPEVVTKPLPAPYPPPPVVPVYIPVQEPVYVRMAPSGSPALSWAAVLGLICGILALPGCCLGIGYYDYLLYLIGFDIASIILNSIGLSSTRKGCAVAGLVCSIIAMILTVSCFFLLDSFEKLVGI